MNTFGWLFLVIVVPVVVSVVSRNFSRTKVADSYPGRGQYIESAQAQGRRMEEDDYDNQTVFVETRPEPRDG